MGRPRNARKSARLSVTLDDRAYADLCALARQAEVSVAWMVRRAVIEMIARHQGDITPELPLRRRTGPDL